MLRLKKISSWRVVFSFLFCVVSGGASGSLAESYDAHVQIYQQSGKYGTYYHMNFPLTSENMRIPVRLSRAQLMEDGGQFEVLIKKSYFPIAAPDCKADIILRMPWTTPSGPGAQQNIEEKIGIYFSLLDVLAGRTPQQNVVVELNPYIHVINTHPLEIELSECNVFFRHSHGRYISHTKSLEKFR